uniref:Uncharacterized protein n=1 Tax=Aegilops tauschii TaxID=37682 RepID=M8CWC5_AEGTA
MAGMPTTRAPPGLLAVTYAFRHEGGGPSKEYGGSAGHPCRSSREEDSIGVAFKQLST